MAREHMDELLDSGIGFAIHLLEKNDEFYPFGIVMNPDGEIDIVHAHLDDEFPLSDAVIQEIVRVLSPGARDGQYKAIGIVSDVRLRDQGSANSVDAIRVDLEDSESAPVSCFLHYSKDGSQINIGSLQAEAGQNVVYPNRR